MTLTQQQVRHFRDCGYLRIDNALESNLIDELVRFIESECSRPVGAARSPVLSGGQLKLYGVYDRNPNLMTCLVRHPRILAPLSCLLGPNIVFLKNRHNQAAVNRPGESEPRLHRDVLQWTRNIITVVVYLQDSTIANGCTYLIPGSQYLPFMGVPQPDGGGTWMDEHDELRGMANQALPILVKRGGVLVVDSLAFHSVGPNNSNTDRMSIVLGYRSVDELTCPPVDDAQVLVLGSLLYRGNDRCVTA
jgi:ectoine hydroxylase-related dioxygenase (phytanoyl-CoA dioxygenase family)